MREITYNVEPTIARFHKSNAFVRGIRGPIGSGKSVGCCWDIYMKACRQTPDGSGVRRSRWCAIRNTYPELKTTTIKTWMEWFADFGKLTMDFPPTFRMRQPLEDGTIVDLELIFLAIELEKDVKKLLSLELTGCWINEARELPKSVVVNAAGRVGRYPRGKSNWSGVIMDTNSPSRYHWWYEAAEVTKPANWEFFDQPPALLEVNGTYQINPAAENLKNLPKGPAYYLDLVGGSDRDFIDVMLRCEYKSIFTGKPVYGGSFIDRVHVSTGPLAVLPGRQLWLSFDFGLTPACVAAQEGANGQLRILREYVSEGMGLTQFLEGAILPDLNGVFRGLELLVTGDPAGVQRSQTDSDDSCMAVLKKFGLNFEPASSNDFEPRRRAVLDRLNRSCDGQPAYLLDYRCQTLRQGFAGGYQFTRMQIRTGDGSERFAEQPEKNMFSHIHDANQYLCLAVDPQRTMRRTSRDQILEQYQRDARSRAQNRRRLG